MLCLYMSSKSDVTGGSRRAQNEKKKEMTCTEAKKKISWLYFMKSSIS